MECDTLGPGTAEALPKNHCVAYLELCFTILRCGDAVQTQIHGTLRANEEESRNAAVPNSITIQRQLFRPQLMKFSH